MNHLQTSTIWLFNIAMENGPFIDGFPIKHGDFHGYVSHNQRVIYSDDRIRALTFGGT